MRLPIRLRLTLVFAASMALLLGGTGAFLYLRLGAELLGAIDTSLRTQADAIAAGIGQQGLAFGDGSGQPVGGHQTFAQILDTGGHIAESSEAVTQQPLVGSVVLSSVRGATYFNRTVPGVQGRARLLVVPDSESGEQLFVVVGSSLAGRQDALRRLLLLLLVGGLAAILLASVAGWLLAGAALGPVERMRREAEAFSLSDRDRRLRVPATADEIERLGTTLNSMLDRLQEAFDRERRFVDEASHELRTPLAILKTETELALSRSRTRPELQAALASASEEATRLAALAEDLLVYSRARGGRLPVHRTETRLSDFLRDAVQPFTGRAQWPGVRIEVEAPDSLVRVDTARLRQAVENLLSNSLKHTPPGGLIRVVARHERGEVRLAVEDSGSGFPPAFLDRAFEPFVRGDADRGAGATGAGLGLAIVRAVALAHGGSAHAENPPGGGARVTMVLRSSGEPG